MVMVFSSEVALNHLFEHEEVVTLRTKKRKIGDGKDWINRERCGKKVADVHIEYLGEVHLNELPQLSFEVAPEQLHRYAKKSGFGTAGKWFKKFKKLNKKITKVNYLYKVTLIKRVD